MLTCSWGMPSGGSHFGITTELAIVAGADADSSIARLAEQGYRCRPELEGTRCVVEWTEAVARDTRSEAHRRAGSALLE